MEEYVNELNYCLKFHPKNSMKAATMFYEGFPEKIQRNLCNVMIISYIGVPVILFNFFQNIAQRLDNKKNSKLFLSNYEMN